MPAFAQIETLSLISACLSTTNIS